jgi:hypothetical protein
MDAKANLLLVVVFNRFLKDKTDSTCYFVLSEPSEGIRYPLRTPVGNCRNHFLTGAKPCRKLPKPFAGNCKALSATSETIFQEVQCAVTNFRNLFPPRKVFYYLFPQHLYFTMNKDNIKNMFII